MSDEQLRRELVALGFTPGPITDSTRGILEKKLQKLRAESAKSSKTVRKGRRSEPPPRSRQQQHVLEDSGEEDEGDTIGASRPSPNPSRAGYGAQESRRAATRLQAEDTEERGTYPRASSARGTFLGGTEEYRPSLGASDREDHLTAGYRSSLAGERFSGGTTEHGSYLGGKYRSSLGGDTYSGGTSDRFDHSGDTSRFRSSLGGDHFFGGTSDRDDHLGDTSRFRSSLGGDRFSGRTSDRDDHLGDTSRFRSPLGVDYLGDTYRSLLQRERITPSAGSGYLAQESRPSSGGDRFLGGTSSSGLGEKYRSDLGRERLSGGTSAYAASYGENRRSVLGGEQGSGGTTDSGYSGLRSRLAGWAGLRATQDEDRKPHGYDYLGRSGGHLSYKSYPGLSESKSAQSRSAWSRSLEYYLSRLLRGLSVLLVVIFLGILAVKSGVFSSAQEEEIKLLPWDCDGSDNQHCKAKQKQIIAQILSELYDFISLEAGSFECGNPSGLKSKCVTINRAKEHVTAITGHSSKKFEDALDWLLQRDGHLGIWPKSEDDQIVTSRSQLFCVESSHPRIGVFCRLTNALYTAISNLFLALFGLLVLWLFFLYLKYHWKKLEDEEKHMFEMVEKIIDVVKQHYRDYTCRLEETPYIGILHVRDTLIMPQDRKRLKRIWDRAVQFIENNESRVRTESQRVAGADLEVWRWIQQKTEWSGERMSSFSLSPLNKRLE